jgi:hypothetical protein
MRRAETGAAVGGDTPPADVQITRAVVAVALGLVFAYWLVLRPVCNEPSVRTLLPELRALSGIPSLVI